MRAFGFLSTIGGVLALIATASLADPASFGSLQKWDGYYPTKYANTRPLPAGQTFWDDPLIKKSLTATLSPEQYKQLTGCWGTGCQEDRIQLYDNMIAVHVCKKDPHDFRACQEWAAYVFVEMDSGRTSVCWNMMVPGDLKPSAASLWIWRGAPGDSGSVPVDTCSNATAFKFVIDQKNGKPVGRRTSGLPGVEFQP